MDLAKMEPVISRVEKDTSMPHKFLDQFEGVFHWNIPQIVQVNITILKRPLNERNETMKTAGFCVDVVCVFSESHSVPSRAALMAS
jgi:hypothetical protein